MPNLNSLVVAYLTQAGSRASRSAFLSMVGEDKAPALDALVSRFPSALHSMRAPKRSILDRLFGAP